MTEKEYLSYVEEVRNKIAANQLPGVSERLEELYCIKPVRLVWFLAKAELLWKQGKMEQSWPTVGDKGVASWRYPGVDSFIRFHHKWLEFYKLDIHARCMDTIYSRVQGAEEKGNRIEEAFQDCLNTDPAGEDDCLEQLMIEYFADNQNVLQHMMVYQLIHSGYYKEKDKKTRYFKDSNYDYLEEKLLSPEQEFIVVADDANQRECDVILSVLHYFKKKAILLTAPVMVKEIQCLEDSMEVSLAHLQEFEDALSFPVIQYEDETGIHDNRCELIQYICRNHTKRNYAILLAAGEQFLEWLKTPGFQKQVECLSNFDEVNFADKINFGWTGDYTAYLSDIYNMDVDQELNAPSGCDFSIIIPARNSAGTLEYTLQTCLQQDYPGTYEIVVSDNSTEGKQEVYQLCRDLGDSRIKYYKTPRNLPLSRSFEFAYIKARGRFLFAIGSDDGVCPWALTYLDRILKKYPQEPVIQWHRGYYAWKGFNKAEQNKLIIPGSYRKDCVEEEWIDQTEYFARALKHKQYIYSFPLLYINSGCQRSYLKTLLKKTGRLWDGSNQDLYIGVMNAAVNRRILNIAFPLTIAGVSSNSLGYISSLPQKDEEQEKLLQSTCLGDNVGIYITHGIVREIPMGTAETCSFYCNLMRAIQLGVLPDSWRQEIFDYRKIYTDHFNEHLCLDDQFDKYIHNALYLAKNRGEEFYNWFLETIYRPQMKPKYLNVHTIDTSNENSYTEGITESGGLIIDASRYGASNIAEAVKVFERFVDWTPESWKQEWENRSS